MKIGQVAQKAGVNIQTVRFYERKGLLPTPPRSTGGYRLYADDTVRRILFIKHAQEIGFSLQEIDELLSFRVHTEGACTDVRHRAEEKVREVEAKIARLTEMKRALVRLISQCEAGTWDAECPILDALDEEHFTLDKT